MAPKPGENVPTPCLPSTFRSRIRTRKCKHTIVLRELGKAVQHTRDAESIHALANHKTLGCLLSSSRSHERESTITLADSFAGPQRDLDFMRHWGKARSGRRDQVVRRCGVGRQIAEAWRLLAHG